MSTAEDLLEDHKPRTSFVNCVGQEVTLFLKNGEEFEALKLPLKGNSMDGRLVGVGRQGLWFEPGSWREDAIKSGGEVQHLFFPWEYVLSILRKIESSKFEEKKQYRGLRPRG